MPTFTYEFEELPLAVVNGIEAAFINGSAEVQYDGDGLFEIGAISVEGFGERVNGKREWPMVPAPKQLADLILHRLSHDDWQDKIGNAVHERIAEDYECERDNWADMRREERMLERF